MYDHATEVAVRDRPHTEVNWDYIVTTIHARNNMILEEHLREHGRGGWELAFMNMPMSNEYQCVFRRPTSV